LLAIAALPTMARAEEAEEERRAAVDTAIAKVYPTLVRIHVVWLDYGGGREQKYEASGSGAIIGSDGLVITNHHVAGRATLITCTLQDRQVVPADLVGTDAMSDIAVLRLRLGERRDPTAPVPVATFGDSSTLKVGDTVLAMGCPRSISQSVTAGIVSNTEMILPRYFGGMELDGEDVGSLVKWIGHDAVIFPGNSGGPLVNLRGEIIGINEIGVGLGGAIPSNIARGVVASILAKGEVKRSWVGIGIQPLLRGSGLERGVLVSGVVDGSPAHTAGIRSGDVLLSWGGKPLTARFAEEIPAVNQAFLEVPAGTKVPVVLLRDGKEVTVELLTVDRGQARGDEKVLTAWGISATDITALMAVRMQRASMSGARVSSMRDGGPAAEAKPPIAWGDVITEVAGQPVKGVEDLVRISNGLTAGKDRPFPVLVAFERDRERLLTVVKIGPTPEDRSTEARKAWFPSAFQVLTTQLAESMGLKGRKGVRITEVWPGTAVEAAGLRVGDILVALDGEEIGASQPQDTQVLPHMIRSRKIGSTGEFTVLRAGEEMKISMELPARPPEGRELLSHRNEAFEMTVRELSFKDRVNQRWGGELSGVYVSSVESGGWAAFGGLDSGDLLVAIDGKAVESVEAFKSRMEAIVAAKPAHVVFQVRRGISSLFIEVHPAW
jgi:serine protease Do